MPVSYHGVLVSYHYKGSNRAASARQKIIQGTDSSWGNNAFFISPNVVFLSLEANCAETNAFSQLYWLQIADSNFGPVLDSRDEPRSS